MTDESNLPAPADLGEIDSEMVQLQTEMADTKGKEFDYWANEGKQARYRQLVEAKERGASVPARGSALDAEILSIQANMATPDYMNDLSEQAR